jgi:hypothetical protein
MRSPQSIHTLSERSLTRLMRTLQAVERAIPVSRPIREFLRTHRPDALIVSPLIDAASEQVDVVRARTSAGIPSSRRLPAGTT